jgi:hypothetical protein
MFINASHILKRRIQMETGTVNVRLAVQGSGCVLEFEVDEGTTIGELRAMQTTLRGLDIKIGANKVSDEDEIEANEDGTPTTIIGTKDVKGGIA